MLQPGRQARLHGLLQPPPARGDTAWTGGTSIGFSDRYHSGLDGQNVDVTHVPAGKYVLVHRTNTQLLIRELRYSNNAASVAIRLTRRAAARAPPAVRVLRVCPDSDRCS